MDTILDDESLKNILDNPLWHLCRSNTENAMSNFWAYLMKNNDYNLKIILGEDEAQKYKNYGKVTEILREKNDMDLQIIFEDGIVVIENKFKSLADQKQIDKYKEKIKKKGKNHFYLITPTGEEDFKENHLTWISYKDIHKNIKNHKKHISCDKEILEKYLDLLDNIVNLNKNSSNNYSLCLFWIPDSKIKEYIKKLQDEKLYAFVTKRLASLYQKKLNEDESIKSKIENGKILQENGFSDLVSLPFIEWWKQSKKGHFEGVQIQNGTFRLCVMSEDKKSEIDPKYLYKWVNTLQKEKVEVNSKKEYNKFGECFKYKYFKIKNEDHLKDSLKKVFNYWSNTK